MVIRALFIRLGERNSFVFLRTVAVWPGVVILIERAFGPFGWM